MKVYKVKVNGKVYEVEVEAVNETAGHVEAAPVAAAASTTTSTNGAKVTAPIAGKLLDIKVKVGDTIKVGQVVAVIEAMKLENEVPSTSAGVVKEIKAAKGSAVNNGDVLVILG